MDFNFSLQPTMNMNMHKDPCLEFEDDDDGFYAELRRQILILTADDDNEEGFVEPRNRNSSNVIKTGSNCSMEGFPAKYFAWWENENTGSTPAWLSKLWRNSNGTGVFIPRIVKSRRKQRPGRMNRESGRTYKRVERSNS